ncbi:MBL fold metallo-hydrolase [Terriglobus sp.]|uniref:MBL fold metallo-hydrolase n=1 Tax=Terriglobus sp. TaxID=1889013 RepID=UPI003AFF73CC
MMRMTVLASGSKGNSAVVASSRTRILVDAGLSCRELMRRMHQVGEDPEKLDAILITHEHADHVSGLPVLARRLDIPVYFTEQTHRAWVRQMTPRTTISYKQWIEQQRREKQERLEAQALAHQIATAPNRNDDVPDDHFFLSDAVPADGIPVDPGIEPLESSAVHRHTESAPASSLMAESAAVPDATIEPAMALAAAAEEDLCDDTSRTLRESIRQNPSFLPAVEYFQAGRHLAIGDIDITPFTIPHDAADPCGFVFAAEGLRVGFATDLGYMPPNVKLALRNCDVLLIESNHDIEMLRDGPYPWSVKQRVLSRVGHLSNDACAEFLLRDYDGGAAYVVLAHLSESNNQPDLARRAAETAVGDRLSLLGNRILLAPQAEPMASLCL